MLASFYGIILKIFIGDSNQALMIEESVVDASAKTFVTYTRNITHTRMMSIIEKCTYYVSPENEKWLVLYISVCLCVCVCVCLCVSVLCVISILNL